MGETPRTDAVVVKMLSDLQSGTQDVVSADFARTLERELAEAKGIIEACHALIDTEDRGPSRAISRDGGKTWKPHTLQYRLGILLSVNKEACDAIERAETAEAALLAATQEIADLKHDIERAVAENTRLLNEPRSAIAPNLPEPAGWRREWDGDESDIGMWVEAWSRDDLDGLGPWEPLYTESQVRELLTKAAPPEEGEPTPVTRKIDMQESRRSLNGDDK